MKTRFLLVTLTLVALSSCATGSGRYPAGGPRGGGPQGGGRPEQAPPNRNQGPPRAQGVVIAQHPGPIAQPPGGGRQGGGDRQGPGFGDHQQQPQPPHQVDLHDNQPPRGVIDRRPPVEVNHDPHVRVMVRRNFHPIPVYEHYHPVIRAGYNDAWWGVWGIQSWDTVGTVTCESANSLTGELYPVTMERDGNGWDDPSINNMLDQALADCSAEAGDVAVDPCVPVTPTACTYDQWDGTVYRTN